jgi:hypothetical protein
LLIKETRLDLGNSQPTQIIKTLKLGDSLLRNPSLQRKPRVRLENLFLVLWKDQKDRGLKYAFGSLKRLDK